MISTRTLVLTSCFAFPFMTAASAQQFPSKPIRVIVGFPAGSPVDTVSRAMSTSLQGQLGQPIVVESRPGAQGTIAGNAVAKADPDGHTVYFGSVTGFNPIFVKTNFIDAAREFAPVSESMSSAYVLYSSAKIPVTTFPQLVAFSKSERAGRLNFATTIPEHDIIMQGIKSLNGISYTAIPYQGAAQIIPALISGEVSFHISLLGAFLPYLEAGTVRALFTTSPKRLPQLPNVPTAAEVGIPNFEPAAYNLGFWAPRGTRPDVLQKLSAATTVSVRAPAVVELAQRQAYEIVGSTPEEQMRIYQAAMKFWTQAAQVANFQPQ